MMGLFGTIIQSCDRITAKQIFDVLVDMEHTIFDYNEEHGIDQCDCHECMTDKKMDRKNNKFVTSQDSPKDIEGLKRDLSRNLDKIRDRITKIQSSNDDAYNEWKKDFTKEKEKYDQNNEEEK